MNIPDVLKGKEVQKFEDTIEYYCFTDNLDAKEPQLVEEKLFDIRDFYRQNFQPEMIKRYFLGWEIKHNGYYEGKGGSIASTPNEYGIFSDVFSSTYPIGKRYILTLSDFVDCCLNSGIKLNWRDK